MITIGTLRHAKTAGLLKGRTYLYCGDCHAQYSSDPSDYWAMREEEAFECGHDRTPLRLVRERNVIKDVKVPR